MIDYCHGPGPQHEATGTDRLGQAWCEPCWRKHRERIANMFRSEPAEIPAAPKRLPAAGGASTIDARRVTR